MNLTIKFILHIWLSWISNISFYKTRFNNIKLEVDELNLTNQNKLITFCKKNRLCNTAAAKVGGIHANIYPADFIYQNLMIEIIINSMRIKSNDYFFSSTCIYPKNVKQPMNEDALLTNVPEPTNEPYAIAKWRYAL